MPVRVKAAGTDFHRRLRQGLFHPLCSRRENPSAPRRRLRFRNRRWYSRPPAGTARPAQRRNRAVYRIMRPVGTLIDLAAIRRRRIAVRAPRHPALRWLAGPDSGAAHRRGAGATALCGATGELTPAGPSVPLCQSCYGSTPG